MVRRCKLYRSCLCFGKSRERGCRREFVFVFVCSKYKRLAHTMVKLLNSLMFGDGGENVSQVTYALESINEC